MTEHRKKKMISLPACLACLTGLLLLSGCGAANRGKPADEGHKENTEAAVEVEQAAGAETKQDAEQEAEAAIEEEAAQEAEAEQEAAAGAEENEGEDEGGPDFVSRAQQLCGLAKEMTVDEIMENYAISLVEGGKYRDYEGDIGDVIPAYKNVDLNGDEKPDVIMREGKHYVIEFSDGNELRTGDYSSAPNEGEVIEFADLGWRNTDEILITHYTSGTAGPTAWDTAIYSNADGSWKEYPVVDKDSVINSKELQEQIAERTGKPYEASSVRVAGVELGDAVTLLLDFGAKEGADQSFDHEAATLVWVFTPDHIGDREDFGSAGFSAVDLVNTWPLEAAGVPVELTPELQNKMNLFLSNFSEQSYREGETFEPWRLAHFALEWKKINAPGEVEYREDRYWIDHTSVNQVLDRYFACNLDDRDFSEAAAEENPYQGQVDYTDGNARYSEPSADGEMFKYNFFTVARDVQRLGGRSGDNSFLRVFFKVYSLKEELYDLQGIGKQEYALNSADAEALAKEGRLVEEYEGMAIVWEWGPEADEYKLWSYRIADPELQP